MTIHGVVTVSPGTLDQGFALQDPSGGIYVAGTLGTAIELGAIVRVTGTLADLEGRVTVEPAAIEVRGRGRLPPLLEIGTGQVGPATEGRLIAVCGPMVGDVVDDRPWGSKLYVNDGSGPLLVFIATSTGIDVAPYHAGQVLRAVGFSGRFGEHTELLPRGPGDIGTVSDVGCHRH